MRSFRTQFWLNLEDPSLARIEVEAIDGSHRRGAAWLLPRCLTAHQAFAIMARARAPGSTGIALKIAMATMSARRLNPRPFKVHF